MKSTSLSAFWLRPCTLRTALNQMVEALIMGVPLKLLVIPQGPVCAARGSEVKTAPKASTGKRALPKRENMAFLPRFLTFTSNQFLTPNPQDRGVVGDGLRSGS